MAAFTSGTWVVPHKLSLRRRRKNTTKATTCRLERTRQGRMGYLSLFRTRGSEAPTSGHQQPRYPRARLDCPAYRAGLAAFNRENTRQPPTLRGVQRPFPTLITNCTRPVGTWVWRHATRSPLTVERNPNGRPCNPNAPRRCTLPCKSSNRYLGVHG